MNNQGSLLGGTLLIAGTTIGGGMLALPVLTSLGGYLPSLVIYLLCWLFMAGTGLLFLEISLWMHKDANIISMAETTLGKYGKAFAWMLYIFLFYCLIVAYIAGCGKYILDVFEMESYTALGPILFVAVFGTVVVLGTHFVSSVNVFFVILMALLYFSIIYIGIPYINFELLESRNWSLSLLSLPVSFTAFAYQGTVPTLVTYLDRDVKKIRMSILLGSFIPFVAYVVWQTVIMGIIPANGPNGLIETMGVGETAVQPLRYFIDNPWLLSTGSLFAFFALLTSFFGVALGLIDFLADGLKIKKTGSGKLILSFLVFVPPLLITIWKKNLFLDALDLAGGYGCALLLGLLPIMMAWKSRYHMNKETSYRLMGGKPLLIIMTIFVLFEVAVQISITTGLFPLSR